ncbi:universal stress protein [Hymenobacter arizonensis]|uniref:Universal stress protein n=1 Tax=Hymenobacter arizonensis TaxID=1227077 RepID=A0A1I5X7F0_HYMAR|nr:universal stress protein [Hymenobacter arizonensis]SFQ27864.1 universal stress protein A [Hymenobacter arizonensis]
MTILCPLDFSAASAGVVAYAAALAVAHHAELRLLHVCEPQEDLAARLPTFSVASSTQPCAERLESLRTAAVQAGAQHVHTEIVRGEAAPEIVAEARRQQADLIVIGAHGCTGITRFLMGTTAEIVLRTAPCATLLVRAPLSLSQEGKHS